MAPKYPSPDHYLLRVHVSHRASRLVTGSLPVTMNATSVPERDPWVKYLNLRVRNLYTVYDKNALMNLVREKALQFGEFTLVSGKKASYYLDGKQITLDATGAHLVGEGILDLLSDRLPDAVGGMSIGADPITAAVLTLAGGRTLPLRGFMVRKEPKDHGLERYIEGPVREGDRVVIVEDVVTTGGSSLLAIERATQFGLKVEGVIAIIDRLEGGEAAFLERGYWLKSLLTVQDFGIEPAETPS